MKAQGLTAINCTNCAAPLPALGGGRARTLTCGFCGAQMDQHDGYRILAQYRDMRRPDGPLGIGDVGALFGIDFTVIGIVEWKTEDAYGVYFWTDYQLYSPTHGYCWLTYENGHFVFSRRVRAEPDVGDLSRLDAKAHFSAMGHDFEMYDRAVAEITYVEGALTWVAKLGERAVIHEGVAPPRLFGQQVGADEVEFELGLYLDPETVYQAFDLDGAPPKPGNVHAAQPYRPGPWRIGMARAAKVFAPIVALLALATLLFGGGARLVDGVIQDPVRGGVVAFEVPRANALTKISIQAPVSNSWNYYDFTLTHLDSDTEIAAFGRDVEFYEGRDDEGYWSEGSQTASATFRPPQAGRYQLEIIAEEGEGQRSAPLRVQVKSGIYVARYLVALAIFFGIVAISGALGRAAFEKRRWGDSNLYEAQFGGDDDDDDD